jgi:hydrogenase small subunit
MVLHRELSRRDFLRLSAGSTAALGLVLFGFPNFEKLLAASVAEVPVLWIQGGSCTGCSVSVLNSLSPKIQEVLVSQVIPGKHVSLRFHPTVMAAQGDLAMKALDDTAKKKGGYLLVVEGSISTKDNGVYIELGERDGHGITMLEHLTTLGPDAMAVIAIGACATHGGVPGAAPNPTGSTGVKQVFADHGINTPLINVPGCPPHPDWFVGTLASVLIGGLGAVEVDKEGRPLAFYSELIHDNCQRRGDFDAGRFAQKFSDADCLFRLGCKGPVTHADCPVRLWNGGTNWCVGSGSPCVGCASLGFPDEFSPLRSVVDIFDPTQPTWLPPIEGEKPSGISPGLAAGIGAAAGLAAGAAGVSIATERAKKSEKTEE